MNLPNKKYFHFYVFKEWKFKAYKTSTCINLQVGPLYFTLTELPF